MQRQFWVVERQPFAKPYAMLSLIHRSLPRQGELSSATRVRTLEPI